MHARAEQPERTVDGLTRDEICRRYQPKVIQIARRFHERLSAEVRLPIEDLAAVGAIGLLEAFDRYDDARGVQFGTFAEHRIRGAMYDALRENDAFGRRRRQLARRIQAETDELRRVQGREPTAGDVAGSMEMPVESYHGAVSRVAPVIHVAFDTPIRSDGDEGRSIGDLVADPGIGPEAGLLVADLRARLKAAVAALPDRQRQAVLMYYGGDLNLAEIAAVFRVTVSRVSQILTESRERLRRTLAGSIEPADLAVGQ